MTSPDVPRWYVVQVYGQPHILGSWYVENSLGEVVADGFYEWADAYSYILEHRGRFPANEYRWSVWVREHDGHYGTYLHDFASFTHALRFALDTGDAAVYEDGADNAPIAIIYGGKVFTQLDRRLWFNA